MLTHICVAMPELVKMGLHFVCWNISCIYEIRNLYLFVLYFKILVTYKFEIQIILISTYLNPIIFCPLLVEWYDMLILFCHFDPSQM